MCVKALVDSETAMAILMPLTLYIPHLVGIDGASVEMWREPGSAWKPSDCTEELLAVYNLSIGPTGLVERNA